MLSQKDQRAQKLEDLFQRSPRQAYQQTLSPWMQSYSQHGMFGNGQQTRMEIANTADSRKPYISKHLAVMDEISKGPKG